MKKLRIAVSALFLLMTSVGYYLGNAGSNGLCSVDPKAFDTQCLTYYVETLGNPIFIFSASLLLASLILLFVRESVYKSWRRFAYWAVPIGVIILWLAPTSTPGGIGISFLDFTKQTASWLVSGAFLLISLFIIIRKSLRSR